MGGLAFGMGMGFPQTPQSSGGSAPVSLSAPVVSGTAVEGQTLTTTNGTWSGSPTGYTYQWTRDGVNIAAATAGAYPLVTADVGHLIGCNVTATNATGSASSASNALGYIWPIPTSVAFYGDSRSAFSGGVGVSGSTQTSTQGHSLGFAGWFTTHLGNKLLRGLGGMYAVSSSTNLRMLDALNSTSTATTGNPAGAVTGNSADNNWSFNSSGDYSPIGTPSNVVFFMPAVVNDVTFPAHYTSASVSMSEIKQILDATEAANKVVFLGNEIPRGYTTVYNESHAVAGATCTATNTSGFVDGSAFGIVACVDQNSNVMTKVASAPAAGQYSVTSGGVYTFNAGSPPTTVYISYAWGPTATPVYQNTLHNWLASSAANFVDPDSSVNWGVPGALYNRKFVRSFGSWDATIDASTGANHTGLPGMHADNTHGAQAGGMAMKPYVVSAFNASPYGGLTLPSKSMATNLNNWKAATTVNNTLTYTLGVPPGVLAPPWTQGSTQVRVVGSTFNLVATETSSGVLTGTGFASGTINRTTGVIAFTLSANPGSGAFIIVEQDTSNILLNPCFDTAQGTVALPTNVTGSALPLGWTLTPDAGTVTALATAASAGGLDVAVSYATVSGENCIVIDIHGNPGTGVNLRLGPTAAPSFVTQRIVAANPDRSRAGANIRITTGPDGHLYGLQDVTVSYTLTSSTSFTRPYGATSLLAESTIVGGSTSAQPYNEQLLTVENPIQLPLVTDTISSQGMTISLLSYRINIDYKANVPISARVYMSLPRINVRPD